jgi:hypothetical protein
MNDTLISFETAKIFNKKEHCLNTLYNYHKETEEVLCEADILIDEIDVKNIMQAPTQSLLQKWLREVYIINVISYPSACIKQKYIYLLISDLDLIEESDEKYNTYEEALEIGLREALKLI